MKSSEVMRLMSLWGDKPCSHPSITREISDIGFSTGDYVYMQCGREVDQKEWRKNKNQNGSDNN